MDCQALIAALTDVVTMVALTIGSYIAITGYNTWKKQLRGETQYDLARRLLLNVYKVRDAIRSVRNPFVSMAEALQAMQEIGLEMRLSSDLLDRDHLARRQEAVYIRRWRLFEETWRGLEADFLEAEVLWGQEVVTALVPLRQNVATLSFAITRYVNSLSGEERPQDTGQAEARRVVFSRDHDDSFGDDVQEAIEEVETFLKRYLTLK